MLVLYGDKVLDGYVETTETYKALTGVTTADLELTQAKNKMDELARFFTFFPKSCRSV